MKYAALIAALLAVSATGALAADPLPKAIFGEPGYGGSGCPDGTANVIRGFSNQAAVYVLDSYKVGDNGRAVDRKTCGIAIPVDVPDGVSVAVRSIAIRGSAELPDGLDATVSIEAFTASTEGEINEIALEGAMNSAYLRFLTIPDDKLQWSECGADINLRANTSLRTRGDKQAAVSLDALVIYPLATRAC